MPKFKVTINRVERYRLDVVVSARSKAEAVRKVMLDWETSEYLYTKTTDSPYYSSTSFRKGGEATAEEDAYGIHVD